MPTRHIATLLGVTCCAPLATLLRHVGCCWLKFDHFQTEPATPNMLQHIATRWLNARNMLRPTVLRYVSLTCCDRLARGFMAAERSTFSPYNLGISYHEYSHLKPAEKYEYSAWAGKTTNDSAHECVYPCCCVASSFPFQLCILAIRSDQIFIS